MTYHSLRSFATTAGRRDISPESAGHNTAVEGEEEEAEAEGETGTEVMAREEEGATMEMEAITGDREAGMQAQASTLAL